MTYPLVPHTQSDDEKSEPEAVPYITRESDASSVAHITCAPMPILFSMRTLEMTGAVVSPPELPVPELLDEPLEVVEEVDVDVFEPPDILVPDVNEPAAIPHVIPPSALERTVK